MSRFALQKCSVQMGSLILVNRDFPCAEGAANPRLTELEGGIPMERTAATLLDRLMIDLGLWPYISPVSGWRSMAEQQKIWDDCLAEYGRGFTEKYVALPGCSEHQTGLAIDLGIRKKNIDFIRPDFPYDGVCAIFRQAAPRYGFVERYPADKEHITGIAHEPWHFRYVGVPHALIMTDMGLALEEYHEFLRAYSTDAPLIRSFGDTQFAVSFAGEGDNIPESAEDTGCSISGDNENGVVITRWRRSR